MSEILFPLKKEIKLKKLSNNSKKNLSNTGLYNKFLQQESFINILYYEVVNVIENRVINK